MMRHSMLLAVAALATTGTQAATTCGANTVTEVQAGAIRLPNDDVVHEHVPRIPSATAVFIRTNSTQAQFEPMALACPQKPGPLVHCEPIYGWLPNTHFYILVEAAPTGLLRCGTFEFEVFEE